jgi:hypothetical protein
MTTTGGSAVSLAQATADITSSDEGGGGSGCFISGSMGVYSFSSQTAGSDILLFLLFAAMMGIGCRKRK